MGWIDLHCHIPMLEQTPDEILEEAKAAGVERLVTIGTCPEDHPKVMAIAEKHFPVVACTLGVHPHDAESYNEDVEKFIGEHVGKPHVIAVAEIGLDYYYDNAPREKQKEAFRSQLEIAKTVGMPVQIHTRDAEEDTIEILKDFKGCVNGTIHCFTGSDWLADEAIELGFDISFSGIVTFKNAQNLRDTATRIPIEHLHVETDSPFLTPVPHRGQKNAPKMVVHTGELVAGLRGMDIESFQKTMKENALRTFPKLSWEN